MEKITFKQISETEIKIMKGGVEIGQIFSPADTSEDKTNAIQVCGFSEAYDFWSCGVYPGFKDIQLLFDDKKLEGEFTSDFGECMRCFHKPCQCEVKTNRRAKSWGDEEIVSDKKEPTNPFIVKRQEQLKDRFKNG